MNKASDGHFFEDFRIGMILRHAVPRTITTGDVALFSALYGMRFALQSSDDFARACGLPRAPLDAMLVFHVIFGKTVPDVSLNAVANLGYAECRFLAPAWPGDSFRAQSEVIGLRENSGGETGIVHVRSTGYNQHGSAVISFVRWVMVRKRDRAAPAPVTVQPDLQAVVDPATLHVPPDLTFGGYDPALAGAPHMFEDYVPGEVILPIDGMTIEEAEHQIATRLFQNTARGHFDAVVQKNSRFGRRIVYGGHVMTIARSLSFNGLANGCLLAAINGGRHAAPSAAGDTLYSGSEVIAKHSFATRADIGALRIRTVVVKDCALSAMPAPDDRAIVLDIDYWLLIPRRAAIAAARQ